MHSCSSRRVLDLPPWIPTILRVRIAGGARHEDADTFRTRSAQHTLVAGAGRLSRQYAAQTTGKAAPAGLPTVEVVKVIEQPLNVTLSLPGELAPYQTVALYSRVTGFVKTIAVDRGSRVRAGQQLAALEAPELVAEKAEAQSKLQSAEAQLATIRSKAEATASTYEKLKAAS